jgi:feruloyl esterase
VARYTGSGSTDDASNFVSAQGDTHVDLNWMGEWLYSPGYEAWCQAQGSQLNCTGGNNWSSYRKTANGF